MASQTEKRARLNIAEQTYADHGNAYGLTTIYRRRLADAQIHIPSATTLFNDMTEVRQSGLEEIQDRAGILVWAYINAKRLLIKAVAQNNANGAIGILKWMTDTLGIDRASIDAMQPEAETLKLVEKYFERLNDERRNPTSVA